MLLEISGLVQKAEYSNRLEMGKASYRNAQLRCLFSNPA